MYGILACLLIEESVLWLGLPEPTCRRWVWLANRQIGMTRIVGMPAKVPDNSVYLFQECFPEYRLVYARMSQTEYLRSDRRNRTLMRLIA